MRPATGGRWTLGLLVVGPMILVQLIYVGLIVQTGTAQAQLYMREGHGFAEYWARSGAAVILVRALLMLGLFCIAVAPVLGSKVAPVSRMRMVVALLAFAGWLCILLFCLLPGSSNS